MDRNGAYSSGQSFDLFAAPEGSLKTCSGVPGQCRSKVELKHPAMLKMFLVILYCVKQIFQV